MSSRKKNLPSPDERKGEAFWRELNSADWDGKSCSLVFEEFVDVMFRTLSAGKVEYKGRAMFQKGGTRMLPERRGKELFPQFIRPMPSAR